MKLNDPIPKRLLQAIQAQMSPGERILFAKKSDLTLERKYGASHLVATGRRVMVLDEEKLVLTLELGEISEIKVDELFGSSRLVAVTQDAWIVLVYYTKIMVPEFGVLSRVLNQLIRRENPQLPEEEELAYCPKCGSPLPERGVHCPLCVPRWKVFTRLLGYMRPFKSRVGLLMLFTGITVGMQLIPPYITKRIVDDVIKGGQHERLVMWVSVMAGCGILYLASRLAAGMLSSWLSARLVSDLRSQLHAAVQRLQLTYFNRRSSGEVVSRIMHDTGELQHFLIDGLPYLMVNCVSFVSIAAILLYLDMRLALLVFLPVPFLIFGANWFWRKLDPLFHKRGSRVSAMHSILSESINGIRVVKAFANEKRRSRKFDGHNDQLFKIRFNIEGTFIGFQEVMFWVMQLGVTGVWFFAAMRISRNDPTLTLGDLLAFVGYIWLLYGPMQWFTAVINWMTHAFAGGERIFSILDMPPEVYEAPDAVSLPTLQGAVSFRNVRFSYERGKEIIKGISFDIAPGEMVGLVGKSGMGKSTLINLICRFYDVDSGQIHIDGHPIDQLKLQELRHQIGMVMQDSFLFNGTIMDNIRYAKPDASFEEVVRAAKAANANDFILDKENGYDTRIGDNGVQLSGGEKQRLTIARAILHDPAILILDEATSSVDSETEKHIQDAIATLIRGRTTIAIAHRLATLRNANRLLVIDDGRLAEIGTHDELMEKDGTYAKLVRMQTELNKIKGEILKE